MVKVSVSLPDETLAQMDYIARRLRLNPCVRRSTLLQQIVYELYMRLQPDDGTTVYNGDIDEYLI